MDAKFSAPPLLARIHEWQDGHGKPGGRADAARWLDEAHKLLDEIHYMLTEVRGMALRDLRHRGQASPDVVYRHRTRSPAVVTVHQRGAAEARFYLTQCGLARLDGDGDGVPCETICR